MTMYFMPAFLAMRAHARASNLTGLNCLASGSYSATGMRPRSMIHSPMPAIFLPFHSPAGIAYSPQWMNMPNRASRHQAIRASCCCLVSAGGASAAQTAVAHSIHIAAATIAPAPSRFRLVMGMLL